MDSLFVLKGQLRNIYAKYSKYIDKGIQFALALFTFYLLNQNLGYMKIAANPVVTLGMAVICAFLPPVATVLCAAGLILLHLYCVSIGIMAVTAIVFLIMFIFYLRFTPKKAVIILLAGLSFALKIPFAVPVAFGLLGTPACALPIGCGVVVYYLVHSAKAFASAVKGEEAAGMLQQLTAFIKQAFQNKEMWVMVIALVICLFVVYSVRRMAIAHAWKAAIVAGAVVNIVFVAAGDMAFGVHASYASLIGGNVAAVIIGLILEVIFFCVDYSRGESLQFEDDEYYYYVKAVPKITVAAPEKTVKRINSREEKREETEIIDTDEIRRKAPKSAGASKTVKETAGKKRPPVKKTSAKKSVVSKETRPTVKKRAPQAKSSTVTGNTEHLLLTQSLQRELRLNKKKK